MDLTRETNFLRDALSLSSIIWEWPYVWSRNFTTLYQKSENKNSDSFGAAFYRMYMPKTGRGLFPHPG